MVNHQPLLRRAPSHAAPGDTADARLPITCSCCRERLAAKVASHRAEAEKTRSEDLKAFHTGTAEMWQAALDGRASWQTGSR